MERPDLRGFPRCGDSDAPCRPFSRASIATHCDLESFVLMIRMSVDYISRGGHSCFCGYLSPILRTRCKAIGILSPKIPTR